jgi:hypothetical protein
MKPKFHKIKSWYFENLNAPRRSNKPRVYYLCHEKRYKKMFLSLDRDGTTASEMADLKD